MITWIIVLGAVYAGLLVFASMKSYSRKRTLDDYMLAGFNIGPAIGVLTFMAALFSAFIFMGMPDMFRVHGVGAWIFLAVSDGAMAFFVVWFGYHIRKKVAREGFKGVAGLVVSAFRNRWAGYLLFASAFIFLIPYAAIQIRGISIFFNAIFPGALPPWGWAAVIVIIMLIYSEIGGFRAIVYSDAIQGLTLLIVIWLIGISCVRYFGNPGNMFAAVQSVNEELLSVPGPGGLFTAQFLIASFIAIVMIPVTQPQLTTRIVVLRNIRSMHRMAVSLGVFAVLVILSTVFIGMYGAVKYSGATTAEFLSGTLLFDQGNLVGALAIVGLFAACLSTTNAQIFVLGSELRSLLRGTDRSVMVRTRIALFVFAVIVLFFSTVMSDELALLARTSFTGTSMMAPLVLTAVLGRKKPGAELMVISGTALVVFLLSLPGIIPHEIGSLRIDCILYIYLALGTMLSLSVRNLFLKNTNHDRAQS